MSHEEEDHKNDTKDKNSEDDGSVSANKHKSYEENYNDNNQIKPEYNSYTNNILSEHLSFLNFNSKVIHFVVNYISQYDDNMTKEKNKYKKNDTRDKCKVNSSAPLLKLLKDNYCDFLFNMIRNTVKRVETDKTIT